MELADLTRGTRKNDFLEPGKFFLQSRAHLSFMRAVRKKSNFLEPDFLLAKPGLSEFHRISMKAPVAQCSACRTSALKVEGSNPGRNTSICQYWKHSKHVRIKQFFGA